MAMLASGVTQWGSVSEWVSGIATTIAVIVALVFSMRSERDQREATLASVYAWVEIRRAQTEGGGRVGVLSVANDTHYPIYKWTIRIEWDAPGGQVESHSLDESVHGLLLPGTRTLEIDEGGGVLLPSHDAAFSVDLRFCDANGQMRHRMPTGKLVKARSHD